MTFLSFLSRSIPRDRERAVTWILALAVAALLLIRLGDRPLWVDEAETANLARNTLRYGVPRTFDGVNRITLYGSEIDGPNGIWIWSPWLEKYVMAASFAAFGASTGSARLPFALASWASVVLLGAWVRRRYGDPHLAWMTVAYLGLSELFLLHARQARYYGLILLAQVLLMWGLDETWSGRPRGRWLIAGALTMMFYGNYAIAVACLPALAGIALLGSAGVRRAIGFAAGVSLLVFLPWILYAHLWTQSQVLGADEWTNFHYYVREIHFHVLPWVALAWPLHWAWTRAGAAPKREALPHEDRLLWGLAFFFPSLLVTFLATGGNMRYMMPLLPVAAVLVPVVVRSMTTRRISQWSAMAILIGTNVVPWLTAVPFSRVHPLGVPLSGPIAEITHPYEDRISTVSSFFNSRVTSHETVMVRDPEFPLMFYTSLRILDARLMESPPSEMPDWILPRSASGVVKEPPLEPLGALPYYERIVIETPAARRRGSLPEPDLREHRTASEREEFVLYRKR